jgi:hypothetical protein
VLRRRHHRTIEAARDKVMADEVRGLVKLGLPRKMAQQTLAARFHLKVDEEESSGSQEFDSNHTWHDLS